MRANRVLAALVPAIVLTTASADVLHVPNDYSSIQEAINAAEHGDEIIVQPGTYAELINFMGMEIYVHGAGPEKPVIDGTGLTGAVVRFVSDEGLNAVFEGFRVINGVGEAGGGICIEGASPTIRDCEIAFCTGQSGGGLCITGGSSAVIEDCLFSANSAVHMGGGAMVAASGTTFTDCVFENNNAERGGGFASEAAWPILTNCSFLSNGALWGDQRGGGVALCHGGVPQLIDCLFEGNVALQGGGLSNETCSPVLMGCTFEANLATGGHGGAMFNIGDPWPGTDKSRPSMTECEFLYNSALWGGAVATDAWFDGDEGPGSEPSFYDCLFVGNTAVQGGVLWNDRDSHTTVEHGAFLANGAGLGGVLFADNASDTFVQESVFIGNSAESGGVVYEVNESGGTYLHSEFIGNVASGPGGVMFLYNSSPSVHESQFEANNAQNGGVLYAMESMSHPTFDGCMFKSNIAFNGGAMYFSQAAGAIAYSEFFDNEAWQHGGAIAVDFDSVMPNADAIEIANTVFINNEAGEYGGAVLAHQSSAFIRQSEFVANTAFNGGAIAYFPGCEAVLEESFFLDNGADLNGGAVTTMDSSVEINDCDFDENWALANGGAVHLDGGSSFLFANRFEGNLAWAAGGALAVENEASPLILNALFRENIGLDVGGAVFGTESSASFMNIVFEGNISAQGGGLFAFGGVTEIDNATFFGNHAWNGGQAIELMGGFVDVVNSILWDPVFGTEIVVNTGDVGMHHSISRGGWPGGDNLDVDPMFLDAAAGDFRLSGCSPAIDAGNNFMVPNDSTDMDTDGDTGEACPHDLFGNSRLVDSPAAPDTGLGDGPLVDLGAFEYQALCWADTNDDFVVDVLDLTNVMVGWGTDDPCADITGDAFVDVSDLVAVVSNWGFCD